MKLLSGLLILLAGAFYVAWPAYSGYRIKTALEGGDVPGLERGIDFPAVRASMRPVVTEKLAQSFKGAGGGTPGGDLLAGTIGQAALPKIVDGALDRLLTPQALIRLHAEGKSFKEVIDGLAKPTAKTGGSDLQVGVQVGKWLAELLGKKGEASSSPGAESGSASAGDDTATSNTAVPEERRLGLGNIKSVMFNGPLSVSVGVARDAKASDADLTATMSFVDGDWKVTGLVPRL